MSAHEQAVYDALRALGVAHEVLHHAPAYTMADCLGLGLAPDIAYCKNLFLCNRQQTQFYLLLALADKAFRTAEVSRQLGVSRLSFAPERLLPEYLGLLAGAVSPFGLLFDSDRRVRLLVDADLARHARAAFHPCVNTRHGGAVHARLFRRISAAHGACPHHSLPSPGAGIHSEV